MVFIRHSKVGLLALALSAGNISSGFALPGNGDEGTSDQQNIRRISPQDIFAFIDRKSFQRTSQMTDEILFEKSYEYLQRQISTHQDSFTELSNNILGLATLLQNHRKFNFPEMDTVGSARHVMTLLKRIIDGGIHDKNNHYARVHYGELLLRRIKNEMTEEEKFFAAAILSQVNRHYTQVGTLYLVELILDYNFLPEGVSENQTGQYCEDLLKSTYSHKHQRTDDLNRAVALLTNRAQTRTQQAQSMISTQSTVPAQTLPVQPENLHKAGFLTLRRKLELKVTALKEEQAAALRGQGVGGNSNIDPNIPNGEQESPEALNPNNVNATNPFVREKRRSDDEIDDLFADSVLNDQEVLDEENPLNNFQSENPFFTEADLRRLDETYPDSDMTRDGRASSLTGTEMRTVTTPQDTEMARNSDDDDDSSSSDDDSSSTSSSDSSSTSSSDSSSTSSSDSSSTSSSDSDDDSGGDSSNTNQSASRRYVAIYTKKQIQDVVNAIRPSKVFCNSIEDRLKIWNVLSSAQKAHYKNNPYSKGFRDHVRHYWANKLHNEGIEIRQQLYKINKNPITDDQIKKIAEAFRTSKTFQNNEEDRLKIWGVLTPEQQEYFDNDPNNTRFSKHVQLVLQKKLAKYGIEFSPSYFFNQIYTDDQVQRIFNNIGKEPFRNNATGREKIWREMTPKQKARFDNDPNNKKFLSHVNRTWSQQLSNNSIEFKDVQHILREPYTDDQIKTVAEDFRASKTFQNNEEDRLKIWRELTESQRAHFGNDPNGAKFSRHVPVVWRNKLAEYGIEFKDVHSILREPYTDEQIKRIADAFGPSKTFQNNEEDRLKIWEELTEGQRAHFENDPNSKPFVRHVHGVWSRKLSKYNIRFVSQSDRNTNNNN